MNVLAFIKTYFYLSDTWQVVGIISGILGGITGIPAIIISWFTLRYSTPKIVIDKMYLTIPGKRYEKYKNISEVKVLQEKPYLRFELELIIRNSRGGAGSIDKPLLCIRFIEHKKFKFINYYKTIKLSPITSHTEFEEVANNRIKTKIVTTSKAYNLSGGQIVNDDLAYKENSSTDLVFVYSNFDKLQYSIEYKNNKGKRILRKITNISLEND